MTNKNLSRLAMISRFLLLFLPLTILCVTGAIYLYKSDIDLYMTKIHYSESASADISVRALNSELNYIVDDLHYLASQDRIAELLFDNNGLDYELIEKDWLSFSRAKKVYDQIRWLDLNGQEYLRINFNNGRPISVGQAKLQNKAQRYYFKDTVRLNRNEVFISPLDLNIEHGVIEQPFKPMIRFGSPVFDSTGKKKGIVIINYSANRLLDRFKNVLNDESSEQWLLNSDSFWLKGPSSKHEWGFMLQQYDQSMEKQYPDVWEQIKATTNGQFVNEHGLWTFNTVYPLLSNSNLKYVDRDKHQYFWKLVFFIPRDEYLSNSWQTGIKTAISAFIILVSFFLGCLWLTKSWFEVRKVNENLEGIVDERTKELIDARNKAEELANTDSLTEINNRRAYFEQAHNIHQQAIRYNHRYTVLMLDIDLFKNINDTYGHEAGDQVLQAMSNTIVEIVRTSDIIGRIGGEEFAVLLPETSLREAKI